MAPLALLSAAVSESEAGMLSANKSELVQPIQCTNQIGLLCALLAEVFSGPCTFQLAPAERRKWRPGEISSGCDIGNKISALQHVYTQLKWPDVRLDIGTKADRLQKVANTAA